MAANTLPPAATTLFQSMKVSWPSVNTCGDSSKAPRKNTDLQKYKNRQQAGRRDDVTPPLHSAVVYREIYHRVESAFRRSSTKIGA